MNKIIIVHFEEDPEAIESFRSSAKQLWHQHINYTHHAIISTLAGLEDASAVVARLMKNQEDIGAIIAPYYGDDAGAKLTTLLKEHIDIAGKIVQAIKDGVSTTDLETKWQANADAIATLLDSLDSEYWPKADVLAMLKDHLACTLKEAVAYKAKDWTKAFEAYDECNKVIEKLACALADGIVERFPEAFVIQYSSKTIKKK